MLTTGQLPTSHLSKQLVVFRPVCPYGDCLTCTWGLRVRHLDFSTTNNCVRVSTTYCVRVSTTTACVSDFGFLHFELAGSVLLLSRSRRALVEHVGIRPADSDCRLLQRWGRDLAPWIQWAVDARCNQSESSDFEVAEDSRQLLGTTSLGHH